MNYALKLFIPFGLGLVAAVINWMILSTATQEVQYVTVKQQLKFGESFNLEMAEPLPVPARFKDLSRE